MCGIWFYLTRPELFNTVNRQELLNKFFENENRGPDNSNLIVLKDYGLMFGFHRLSIRGLTSKGNQPFVHETEDRIVYVICNGEIYNYKELAEKHDITLSTGSDCEIIGHLYMKVNDSHSELNDPGRNEYNEPDLLNELNGEFAFVIFDLNKKTKSVQLFISRDQNGIRPLYITHDKDYIMGSSVLNGILCNHNTIQFPPRCYTNVYNTDSSTIPAFTPFYSEYMNYDPKSCNHGNRCVGHSELNDPGRNVQNNEDCYIKDELSVIHEKIRNTLSKAVLDRMDSDREVGCLLSGGLDSSLTAGIASAYYKGLGKNLNTFSISMQDGSPDEICAKIVAEHIGSKHTHVLIPPHEWLQARKKVIRVIGSYDVTTVRASTGQYLLAKWIRENTNIKVLIIGDGSDEVTGGYMYELNAPDEDEYNLDVLRLTNFIHYFDGLRADRCISEWGLEARLPFLDRNFVRLYMSIPIQLRMPKYNNSIEKKLLRNSFKGTGLLPDAILYRPKEAFSDGISIQGKSWYQIIQENVESKVVMPTREELDIEFNGHIVPTSKEELLYRRMFRSIFGDKVDHIVPYKWLPKWCGNITEPSARVLSVYSRRT